MIVACPRCRADIQTVGVGYCTDCGVYTDWSPPTKDAPAPKRRDDPRTEAQIRMAIRAVLDAYGFVVVDTEQGYRRDGSTRVRKGLADLYVMGYGASAWVEIKSATGAQTPAQEEFAADCLRSGVPYLLWRHEDEARDWAIEVSERIA